MEWWESFHLVWPHLKQFQKLKGESRPQGQTKQKLRAAEKVVPFCLSYYLLIACRLISVWGCMSPWAEKLEMTKGIVDGSEYHRVLTWHLVLFMCLHARQCCCPYITGLPDMLYRAIIYSSQETMDILDKFTVLEWPANSPDLNPIENVCGYIKQQLDGCIFESKEACFTAVKRHLDAFYEKHSKTLAETMPARIQALIKQKGW